MVAQYKPADSEEKKEESATPEVVEEETPASSPSSASTPPTISSKEGKKEEGEEEEKKEKVEEKVEEVPLEKKNTKYYLTGIIVFILTVGATITILYFRAQQSVEKAQKVAGTQAEVTEPSLPPSPTPLPREEISLEILNGSEVSGLASKTAAIFEELGYEIVKIGNADEIEGNELYVDPEIEDLVDNLLEDVEEELGIASIAGELTDSTASARIILGE